MIFGIICVPAVLMITWNLFYWSIYWSCTSNTLVKLLGIYCKSLNIFLTGCFLKVQICTNVKTEWIINLVCVICFIQKFLLHQKKESVNHYFAIYLSCYPVMRKLQNSSTNKIKEKIAIFITILSEIGLPTRSNL